MTTSKGERVSEMMLVNNIFGPTIQGEGRQAGQFASFVRLGGCNLTCHFCDTPETWVSNERQASFHRSASPVGRLGELTHRVDVYNRALRLLRIANRGDDHQGGLVVITGGEPLLQLSNVAWLVESILMDMEADYLCAIETAGTIDPRRMADQLNFVKRLHWNVSPKLANSGNTYEKRFVPEAITTFASLSNADFKFVITSPADILEVEEFQDVFNIPGDRIWLMPEGTTVTTILAGARRIANAAMNHGWNVSLRNHILIGVE